MNFKIAANVRLISTLSAQKKSESCKEEIRFFVFWYHLPRAQNIKPIFLFPTPLVQKFPAGTLELIRFGANSDPRRNCTLCRNFSAGTSELTLFWRQLGRPLGMKIPRDSLSGIPLHFCWRLRINCFWRQLGSLLELSRLHLGINSVWRQFGSPLGFAIPGDSFSGIPPCFPPFGFTLLICSCGTTFSPLGVYYSSPLLENYIYPQVGLPALRLLTSWNIIL